MPSETITLLGTASIQDYIFRSNRLKENVGASLIVKRVLDQHPQGSTVLFSGGGNAALLFPTKVAAIDAIKKVSRNVLQKSPGLRLVVTHEERQERDGKPEPLALTMERARAGLMRAENQPPFGSELGALPVVRECVSTGLAAGHWHDGNWLSTEAKSKREAAEDANDQLAARYREILGEKFMFPLELDKLGTEKGASQIAIVHADGDGIGRLIREQTQNIDDDTEYKARLSQLSQAIASTAEAALIGTLRDLKDALPALEEHGVRPTKCEPEDKHAKGADFWFPVRPIVSGGDDLTFVCHGKLGLALASRYLIHFGSESEAHRSILGKKLSASAGILIMPQKFPFARGYHLVDELASSAKQMRKLHEGEPSEGPWLDFQILLEGSPGSLAAIRSGSQFKDGEQDIHLPRRPYLIGSHPHNSWSGFVRHWKEIADTEQWPRSRAKRLFAALVRGREETKNILAQFKARDLEVKHPGPDGDTFVETCIGGTSTTLRKAYTSSYFDALEALDFHIEWPEHQSLPEEMYVQSNTAH